MNVYEALGLLGRFEATHSTLPDTRRLVRKFSTIIRILLRVVDRVGDQFSMRYPIAFQLVGHDLSGRLVMSLQQPLEEFLGCFAVASTLEKHIDDLPVLIDCSPQIMPDAADLNEHLINIKCIAETALTSLQSSRIL